MKCHCLFLHRILATAAAAVWIVFVFRSIVDHVMSPPKHDVYFSRQVPKLNLNGGFTALPYTHDDKRWRRDNLSMLWSYDVTDFELATNAYELPAFRYVPGLSSPCFVARSSVTRTAAAAELPGTSVSAILARRRME